MIAATTPFGVRLLTSLAVWFLAFSATGLIADLGSRRRRQGANTDVVRRATLAANATACAYFVFAG